MVLKSKRVAASGHSPVKSRGICRRFVVSGIAERGICFDDLISTAVNSGQKMMLLIEMKGTTRHKGLSRWMEAKMFYQLARTYVTIMKRIPTLGKALSKMCSVRRQQKDSSLMDGCPRTRLLSGTDFPGPSLTISLPLSMVQEVPGTPELQQNFHTLPGNLCLRMNFHLPADCSGKERLLMAAEELK